MSMFKQSKQEQIEDYKNKERLKKDYKEKEKKKISIEKRLDIIEQLLNI